MSDTPINILLPHVTMPNLVTPTQNSNRMRIRFGNAGPFP